MGVASLFAARGAGKSGKADTVATARRVCHMPARARTCDVRREKTTGPKLPSGLLSYVRVVGRGLPAAAAFTTVAAAVTAIAAITTTTTAATTPTTTPPTIAATATAAAATTPAAATTDAAAATTTPAAATTTAAAATATLFAGLGFVDGQITTFERLAVHAVDGGFATGAILELDEAEAAGAAGFAVHHEDGADDFTELLERLTQGILGDTERQITNVELHALHSQNARNLTNA